MFHNGLNNVHGVAETFSSIKLDRLHCNYNIVLILT